MNTNHAILKITTGSGHWFMQVMQPDMPRNEHWTQSIYIPSDAVRSFLRDEGCCELAVNDADDMVVVFRKISDGLIRISIYDIVASWGEHSISGHSALINVPAEKLLAVPDQDYVECRILCESRQHQPLCQSRITLGASAHRNIRMLGKHERKAFSKFIRNAFRYGSECHIHISGSYGGEFMVYENGDLYGGIIPSHYERRGHASVRYELHT